MFNFLILFSILFTNLCDNIFLNISNLCCHYLICGHKDSCHAMISPASLCPFSCSWLSPFQFLPPQYHNHFYILELYDACIWSSSLNDAVTVVLCSLVLPWNEAHYSINSVNACLNINVLCLVSILILLILLSEGLWQ